MVTGLEKVSFHSNPKEGQCQRVLKLLQNCAHFTCQQDNAQNPSSQASTVHKLRISIYTSCIQKRQRNQRSNCQQAKDHRESKEFQKNIYFSFINYAKSFDYVDNNKLENSSRDGHLTCFLRNLYARQEATLRTRHGTVDWFQVGEGVCQGSILSPCLFNLYAEYIMLNAGLDESKCHHRLDGREFEQTAGDSEGQGNMACCSPWGCKELDTAYQLNSNNIYVCVCVLSCFSCVQLRATLWILACQAPLSMGFSRQEYWNGLPCPPPVNLPDVGIKPASLLFNLHWQSGLYRQYHLGVYIYMCMCVNVYIYNYAIHIYTYTPRCVYVYIYKIMHTHNYKICKCVYVYVSGRTL